MLDHVFPILVIFTLFGDIRDRSRKLCKIAPNFACFGPECFLREGPRIFGLVLVYKAHQNFDHVAKFHGDRPRELGDRRFRRLGNQGLSF